MEFIDLKAQYHAYKADIDRRISAVLEHGQFIMGPEVASFEQELASFLDVKHVVSCASGTDALQLACMAYDIKQGDAIFCPDVTFIASVEAACMLGVTPVFCDIDPKTYNLDPNSLKKQIENVIKAGMHTPRAVVAVDFLGNPADYAEIRKICDRYGLLYIADVAQSIGASYRNRRCGHYGDVSCTSFFPAKPLGCYGDGGALMTNDDSIAALCQSLRVHGKGKNKYDNVRIGLNSRLDTVQAAILLTKLAALEGLEINQRQEVAARYSRALGQYFQIPQTYEGASSIYAQYALLAESSEQRDYIMLHLTDEKIPNMVYYPTPMHRLEVFASNPYRDISFSESNRYCNRTFSIPMSPYLSSDNQNFIIKQILNAKETFDGK